MNMYDPLLPPPGPNERPVRMPAPEQRPRAARPVSVGDDRAARIAAARASMEERRAADRSPVTPRSSAPRAGAQAPRRAKHPAMSARILAVGLSTMAVLGMTAGYSMAEKAQKDKQLDGDNTVTLDPAATVPDTTPVVDPATGASATPQARQQTPQKQQAQTQPTTQQPRQPQQIQVPAPAQPAPGGGNTQNSSGSH